jgi:hypothetical protein
MWLYAEGNSFDRLDFMLVFGGMAALFWRSVVNIPSVFLSQPQLSLSILLSKFFRVFKLQFSL